MSQSNTTRCLIIPGLGNSNARHWQTRWEFDREDCQRVELGNWDNPSRSHWVTKLDLAISHQSEPVVLVAHSLGCLVVAWWSVLAGTDRWPQVLGAMLVAPPDVEQASNQPEIRRFAPFPRCRLPFPTVVVASENDPYCSITRARFMATRWGASFVNVGALGHINAASALGTWLPGQNILDRLKSGEIGYSHSEFEAVSIHTASLERERADWPETWLR